MEKQNKDKKQLLKLGRDREIQNNIVKYVRNVFKLKKKQAKNQKTLQLTI